jgi:hypothetical protein
VPFLSLVHLHDLRCSDCGAKLAVPGARSFVVDEEAGVPVFFDENDPPAEMTVELLCPQGHATTLLLPNEIAAEETLTTPDTAPVAADAVLRSGSTQAGVPL